MVFTVSWHPWLQSWLLIWAYWMTQKKTPLTLISSSVNEINMCTFHSWKDFRTVGSASFLHPCLGTNIVHCYILNVFQLHFIDIKKYKRLKYTDGQQSRGKWNIEFLSTSSVLPNIDCPSLVKPRLTSLQQKEVMMLVTAVRTNIAVPSHMWITDFHWLQINIKSENFVDCTLFFVSNSEAVGSFHRRTMLVLKWRMSQLLKFTKWKWSERWGCRWSFNCKCTSVSFRCFYLQWGMAHIWLYNTW